MIELMNVDAGYGAKQVLHGICMSVAEGEAVALVGPNGAGKSTLLKLLCGLVPAWAGAARLNGVPMTEAGRLLGAIGGVAFVPQGHRVFPELTVSENLEVAWLALPGSSIRARMQEAYDLFPCLGRASGRAAATLSGGEQQMLALARALLTRPRLLLLDEPSLGLAPPLAATVFGDVLKRSREQGATVVVAEQRTALVLNACDRFYALRLGSVVLTGSAAAFPTDGDALRRLFL